MKTMESEGQAQPQSDESTGGARDFTEHPQKTGPPLGTKVPSGRGGASRLGGPAPCPSFPQRGPLSAWRRGRPSSFLRSEPERLPLAA